jgi:hypothetical protein
VNGWMNGRVGWLVGWSVSQSVSQIGRQVVEWKELEFKLLGLSFPLLPTFKLVLSFPV